MQQEDVLCRARSESFSTNLIHQVAHQVTGAFLFVTAVPAASLQVIECLTLVSTADLWFSKFASLLAPKFRSSLFASSAKKDLKQQKLPFKRQGKCEHSNG
jgi:nitrogen fixation/metabolism regulation signal transduction histidine kinase